MNFLTNQIVLKRKITNKKTIFVRDVSTGATGATEVAPKFSDTLTLSPPGGEDSAHHRRGPTKNFPVDTSLNYPVILSTQNIIEYEHCIFK